MESVAECEWSAFDVDGFYRDHWRKRPLFVRGGAAEFLGRVFSAADFDRALTAARAAGHPVSDRDGAVTFIEQVSRFDGDLAVRAQGFAARFGTPEAWFDTVRTGEPDGIGPHFDHSDNFVLQQDGTKEWSLAAPAAIDRAEIARRMLNVPGVGSHDLPAEGRVHVVLEPGDLLYIPLCWLHSGVSRGPSLSLSLVCPAVSLHAAVLPALTRAARQRLLGHQPVPALPEHLTGAERADVLGTLRHAVRSMLTRLSDEELGEAVLAALAERIAPGGGR